MDLNEAKEIIKNNYPPDNYTMLRESLDWLIEQAEKVEELKKDNRSLNMEIGSYAAQWQDLVERMDTLTEQMKLLTNNMYIPK